MRSPDSSHVSRVAHSSTVSPGSRPPAGAPHASRVTVRTSNVAPSASVTKTTAAAVSSSGVGSGEATMCRLCPTSRWGNTLRYAASGRSPLRFWNRSPLSRKRRARSLPAVGRAPAATSPAYSSCGTSKWSPSNPRAGMPARAAKVCNSSYDASLIRWDHDRPCAGQAGGSIQIATVVSFPDRRPQCFHSFFADSRRLLRPNHRISLFHHQIRWFRRKESVMGIVTGQREGRLPSLGGTALLVVQACVLLRCVGSEAHATHLVSTRAHRSSLFGLVGDDDLGGQEERRDGRSVLQRRARDLGRVDDALGDQVDVLAVGRVQTPAGGQVADLLGHDATLKTTVDGDLLEGSLGRDANDVRTRC